MAMAMATNANTGNITTHRHCFITMARERIGIATATAAVSLTNG